MALPLEAGPGCGGGPGCRSSIGAGCAGAARSGTGWLPTQPSVITCMLLNCSCLSCKPIGSHVHCMRLLQSRCTPSCGRHALCRQLELMQLSVAASRACRALFSLSAACGWRLVLAVCDITQDGDQHAGCPSHRSLHVATSADAAFITCSFQGHNPCMPHTQTMQRHAMQSYACGRHLGHAGLTLSAACWPYHYA